MGAQTVNALAGNLSLIFDNVTQFSNLVYFDDQVQKAPQKTNPENIPETNWYQSLPEHNGNGFLSMEVRGL